MQTLLIDPTRYPVICPVTGRTRGPPLHKPGVLRRARMLPSSSPDDVDGTQLFAAIHLILEHEQLLTREPTHTDANTEMEA